MFKHDLKLKMAILFIVFLESWLLGALRFDWNFASFLYGVLFIVFLESWLLGALRFDWNFASFLYGVLNIPFGIDFQ